MRNNPYAYALLEFWAWVSCWLWNVAHNAIAHPLIPILPRFLSDPIHDWTYRHWQRAQERHRFGPYRIEDDF